MKYRQFRPYYIVVLVFMLMVCCRQHHRDGWDKSIFCYRQADTLLAAHRDEKAVAALIASADYALKADNSEQYYLSQYKLGDVLSANGLYMQADSVYDALALLQEKNKEPRITIATRIAQCDNLVIGNVALGKAERLLRELLVQQSSSRRDSVVMDKCCYLLAAVYRNKKQLRRAISVSREGLKWSKDKDRIAIYDNLLQKSYDNLHRNDSASFFMERSMHGSGSMISSIYIFKMPNHKKQMCIVFKDFPSLSGTVNRSEPNKAVLSVLAEHNHAASHLVFWLVVICFIPLLGIGGFCARYGWRRHQRRSRMIDELSSQVDDLKKNSLMIDYKKTGVYTELLQLAQTNFMQVDSPIEVTSDLWNQLFDIINEHNPYFLSHLKNHYDIVHDEDIRLCCLLHLGLTYLEVARLYGCSKQAIYKHRDVIVKHSRLSSKKEFAEMIQSIPSA